MEANTNDRDHLPDFFFNPTWESSMDHQGNDPFESALSSMVSSPVAPTACPGGDGQNFMIKELIGRLGVICNSGDISPHSYFEAKSSNNSTNISSYNTPLNSPPKLSLSTMDQQIRGHFQIPGTQFPSHHGLIPLSADPGFAERAARLSCFGNRNLSGLNGNFSSNPSELPPRRGPGNQPANGRNSAHPEAGDSREGSSLSEQIPAGDFSANARKRKSAQRGKLKDSTPSNKTSEAPAEKGDPLAKKAKSEEATENSNAKTNDEAGEDKNQKQSKDSSNSKPSEPPKDYIHVRARRGQATDSHSLAERVRREKISQRMKVLQDLVPGCNKVTGKAVMLDEIINYVQSLQRQVEFLSMKLSTLNPRMDFNVEALLSKEIFQSRGSLPHSVFPIDSTSAGFPYGYQPSHGGIPANAATQLSTNLLNSAINRNNGMQLPQMDGFDGASSQVSSMWDDDLQSLVQMGIAQNQPLNFHGSVASSQMKVEL